MKVNKIKDDVYKKLLNDIFKKCDMISLEKYNDQHKDETRKVIDIITKSGKYLIKKIINDYSIELLNEIYDEFKNNINIFDDDYKKKYEQNKYDKKMKINNRKSVIQESLNWEVYDYLTNSWLNSYKNNIAFSSETYIKDIKLNNNYSSLYFVRLDNALKEEILNIGLYDWCFPLLLENLSFYKNGFCWLSSVAHEEICEIYFQEGDKLEYEYLKSIGIEFIEKEFVPTPIEDIPTYKISE